MFLMQCFLTRENLETLKEQVILCSKWYFTWFKTGKKAPFCIYLAELIHHSSRSKKVIQIVNQLGLCMSYDELEIIEIGLAKHTVGIAGDYRASILPVILPSKVIHAEMDNFNYEEGIRVLATLTILKGSGTEQSSTRERSKAPQSQLWGSMSSRLYYRLPEITESGKIFSKG